MSTEKGFSAGSVILAFLVGGLTGAAVALLFAPQSGKQTREKISDLAGEVSEKAEKLAKDLKAGVKDAVEIGKETLEEKKKMIAHAYEAGLDAIKKG